MLMALAIIAMVLLVSYLVHVFIFRGWLSRWGATAAELQTALPGDEAVPAPRLAYTQAVTVAAPPEAVWPWLVQIGEGRGGLYSYDWLENMAGCKMHSVDRIVPELQNLQIGEMIKIAPTGGPSVEALEANRYLLLSAHVDEPKLQIHQTWVFALQPAGAGATRLITRSRINYGPAGLMGWLMWDLFADHGGVVMQRKMLLGIKRRAEAFTAVRLAANSSL